MKAITAEEFYQLGEDDRLQMISDLHNTCEQGKIIDLLLAIGLDHLDGKLLSELAKAYNNSSQIEAAIAVLEMIPEEERDAVWYYRYGYAHVRLSEDLSNDFESESKNALCKLDKAIEIARDDEIINWCIELVSFSDLKKALEEHHEKYPLLHKKYFEYVDKNVQRMNETMDMEKKKKCKKITAEDIRSIEDSWEIIEQVYDTVNIYDSYEEYLESAKPFTLEQRYLLAMQWYFMEVNNGGHHQFFYNSTGIVWEDALNGFKRFGMNEFANNFANVVEYFGGRIPFDRRQRWNELQRLEKENEEEFFQVLDEADDFIYAYEGEETELTYIKNNPEKFL